MESGRKRDDQNATGGLVSEAIVTATVRHPIVFALANPEPEISPDHALAAASIARTSV